MVEKTYQRLIASPQYFLKRLITGILPGLAFLALSFSAARAQSISLISDEESEQLLADIARPLFHAANLRFDRGNIYLVNDPSLNAFVADGNGLFIHTGTILAADSPNELAGVIAHETGHIEGGHILRQKLKAKEMSQISLVSALLAGTAAAVSGRGDAAMAVLLGSQSSALTHYTRYRTQEERSADEAALKLLAATGQTPQGMLTFMKRINQNNVLNGREETPYFRTHPITQERISFFEQAVKNPPSGTADPRQEKFDRVKAKLYAFLNSPEQTFSKYPVADKSVAAGYARAIARFKQLKFAAAQKEMDELIKKEPGNPFFHELKGQIFLESGQIKSAAREYEKALALLPSSPLLQESAAQAILENNPTPLEVQKAVNLLNKALLRRPNAGAWLLLSRAYGLKGDEASAAYAAAEFSLGIGARDTAERQALQARKQTDARALKLKIDDLLIRIKNLNEK